MSTLKKQFEVLSDLALLIKSKESGNDYNIVYGGIKKEDHPWKPLTQMTIREVLQWQESIDHKYMSEAAGAWQIMEDTLEGVYKQAGLNLDDLFNEENQDRMALQLMKQRGLDRYIKGEIDIYKFGNNLAKEWASLPVVKETARKGKTVPVGASYYAGDGLNKAHIGVEDFLAALGKIKEAPAEKENRTKPTETKTVKLGAAAMATAVVPEVLPEDFSVDQILGQVQALQVAVDKLEGLTSLQTVVMVILTGYIIYNRVQDFKEGRK